MKLYSAPKAIFCLIIFSLLFFGNSATQAQTFTVVKQSAATFFPQINVHGTILVQNYNNGIYNRSLEYLSGQSVSLGQGGPGKISDLHDYVILENPNTGLLSLTDSVQYYDLPGTINYSPLDLSLPCMLANVWGGGGPVAESNAIFLNNPSLGPNPINPLLSVVPGFSALSSPQVGEISNQCEIMGRFSGPAGWQLFYIDQTFNLTILNSSLPNFGIQYADHRLGSSEVLATVFTYQGSTPVVFSINNGSVVENIIQHPSGSNMVAGQALDMQGRVLANWQDTNQRSHAFLYYPNGTIIDLTPANISGLPGNVAQVFGWAMDPLGTFIVVEGFDAIGQSVGMFVIL